MLFHVSLNLFLQLAAGLGARRKHNGGLDHLAPDGVRRGGDGAFQHIGQLHNHALNLKGPNAVAGRLDHVIGAAHIPEVPVLVPPGGVAGVVHAIVPGGLGVCLVLVISPEQAARRFPAGSNDNLAGFPYRGAGPVREDQIHIIQGAGHAHGPHLGDGAHRIVDDAGGFRLAKALHQHQARGPLPLLIDLRIQGLPGGGGVLNAGQVVLAEVLLDEEPVHGRRGAEGGDVVFCEHGQNVVGVKPVEVIGEDGRLAHPLAIVLAPHGLAPACVRNGEVQAIWVYIVPVAGRNVVAQGVFIAVLGNFGVPGGAGGKVHQHQIVSAGGVRLALVHVRMGGHLPVKIMPAGQSAVVFAYQNFHFHPGAMVRCPAGLSGGFAIRCADNSLDPRRLEPVVKVVLHQLIGSGNDHRAHFVQSGDHIPELVVALEHHQYLVAPADAQRFQIVGGLVGKAADVGEGEPALVFLPVHMEHGQLIRGPPGNFVYNIKGEIEIILVFKANPVENAVFIQGGFHKGAGYIVPVLPGQLPVNQPLEAVLLGRLVLSALHHHSVKLAVLPAGGNHAVGGAGVVVDGVPLVENLNVRANLGFHRALYHNVELLPRVAGQLDGHMLLGLAVGHGDKKGLGGLVFKQRGQVQIFKTVPPGNGQSVPMADDGVGGEGGAYAANQVGGVHAKTLGALVDEGEAKVLLPRLAALVFLPAGPCALGHFVLREAGNLPHGADALGYLRQLGFQICFFHWTFPLEYSVKQFGLDILLPRFSSLWRRPA